jgi:hypothetical protein
LSKESFRSCHPLQSVTFEDGSRLNRIDKSGQEVVHAWQQEVETPKRIPERFAVDKIKGKAARLDIYTKRTSCQ